MWKKSSRETFMKTINNIGEIGKCERYLSLFLYFVWFSYFCWFFQKAILKCNSKAGL